MKVARRALCTRLARAVPSAGWLSSTVPSAVWLSSTCRRLSTSDNSIDIQNRSDASLFFKPESLPDLGEVESTPLSETTLQEVSGAWIVIAGSLQGELVLEKDGFCFFRPANLLGHGIGKFELHSTAANIVAFTAELEVYLYSQTSREPPVSAKKHRLTGLFSRVKTSAQNYTTLTISGHIDEADSTASKTPLHAAKIEPSEPPVPFSPNREIAEGFQQLFPIPFSLGPTRQISDLSPHRIGDIPNVYYVPDYVTKEAEDQCLQQLLHTPKELKKSMDRRVVQEYGGTMCPTCQSSFVADLSQPPWSYSICEALVRDGVFSPVTFPNNVRIHEYDVGHGIAPHVDGPIYVPKVAILSLKSTVVMRFYPYQTPHQDAMEHYNDTFRFDGTISKMKPQFSVVLEPRSLLVFEADAYYFHPHGISADEQDSLLDEHSGPIVNRHLLRSTPHTATSIERKPRVGVTIRHLLPRCSHQQSRTEFYMKQFSTITQPISVTSTKPMRQVSDLTSSKEATHDKDGERDMSWKEVSRKLDRIIAEQNELREAVQQLQTITAHSATAQAQFQGDVAEVLDHLTSTTVEIKSLLNK